MSNHAYKNNENIEVYKFGELLPKFKTPDSSQFELQSLEQFSDVKNGITDELIRQERGFEAKSTFSIDEIVREHRGLSKQEQEDYEKRVAAEVQSRVEKIKEKSYQEGFEKGKELGHEKAHQEATEAYNQSIQFLQNQVEQAIGTVEEIYDNCKLDAYAMIRNLSKWVILKEIDEKKYLERLLEKLILEIKTKNNLLIRVNQSAFGDMPEIIEKIEKRMGQLTNVRVEIEMDMKQPGIILESENGIIDGSLDAQFSSIDKLFEGVGLDASEQT